MKNFSNKYMFLYSAALVTVVALVLAVVAMSLKERQDANKRNEKMQQLLKAIDITVDAKDAEAAYKEYFKQELTINTEGEIVTCFGVDTTSITEKSRAFNTVLKDQQKVEKENAGTGLFPVYVFEKDGQKGYVIPMQGNGLWGAVYANLALQSDLNTVVGVTFSHDSETPGLGDKITTPQFQQQFVGKQILDEQGKVASIRVMKNADKDDVHAVDAISGGTMTSNGVDAMILADLERYQKFIDSQRGLTENAEIEEVQIPVESIAIEMSEEEKAAQEAIEAEEEASQKGGQK